MGKGGCPYGPKPDCGECKLQSATRVSSEKPCGTYVWKHLQGASPSLRESSVFRIPRSSNVWLPEDTNKAFPLQGWHHEETTVPECLPNEPGQSGTLPCRLDVGRENHIQSGVGKEAQARGQDPMRRNKSAENRTFSAPHMSAPRSLLAWMCASIRRVPWPAL